ncbi:MAG: DPP IV N-terminal domain-containing protein, partial [Ignavibacteriae bacterium]|nr:DPP IV N-terminal domain-containing protein [Ignavibacteriota bacterium]
LLFIFFIFFSLNFAQKKQFKLEDVVFNSYTKLAPKTLKQLDWIPNTDFVSYIENDTTLIQQNSEDGEKEVLLNLNEINTLLDAEVVGNKLRSFPIIKWIDENKFTFWKDNFLIMFNVNNRFSKISNLILDNAKNVETAPNNIYTAFTLENNLFAAIDNSTIIKITDETNENIVSGQRVSRSEFGIKDGIFWSPKSNYLAFYQKDESMVADYPLVEIGDNGAKLKNIKYPMVGQKSENVKVGVFNINTGNTVWLKTGEPKYQYLTNVTWDPTETYILIAHLNRDQNHMRLIKYNAKTGEPIKTLFEEKDNEYVEPEHSPYFLPTDSTKFLWFSERDNWNHLYLYDIYGKLIKQVTKGNWNVKEILGIDDYSEDIYITSTMETPLEDHAYRVNLNNGTIIKITTESANHKLKFNQFNYYLIDTYSSLTTPSVTNIIDEDGEVLQQLNISENPISDFNISKPKIFTIKGKNNIDLYCRLILPTDFDSTKKYPVIFYVYGGPHKQLVRNSWFHGRYDYWSQFMAQHGYILFTLDNRGSANRGLEFEQAVFRHLGTLEVEDQLQGLNYLTTLPYVDPDRVGVFFWSYGGFMATSLMLKTNNAFKVGVGGGAVIDWKYYEVMYGERYMDTPDANPEGYEESNLLNYVQNLDGKLLLVHGTSDPKVVWEHTLEFVKRAANLNKPLDYYPYVNHEHGVNGKDALHLYTKIS